jgi:hypothetical protein
MTHLRDWRIELIEAHRGLFHPPAGAPGSAVGYPWCEEGWHDLLQRLCVRLKAALGDDERIQIVQIKEKFGTLRVYWRGEVMPATAAKLHEAIALAEARSACTCEQCGADGRLYNNAGVYMTRCAAHAKGAPVPTELGQENVHLVRIPTPDGYRIVPRRYDRDTDTLAEVPRPTKSSEE